MAHGPEGPLDVLVIGAGVAGLCCALDAAAAGLSVRLVEASDGVGGRMRTDARDGFLLDRGFQVFNPDYPQTRRRVRRDPLHLHRLTPGFLLHTRQGRVRVADPVHHPGTLADVARGRLGSPKDLALLAILSARDAFAPARSLKHGEERTAHAALRAAGISEGFIDRVLRPFFAGVFLEPDLATSSRVFHLVWRSMLRGRVALPAAGIGAVPAQLAAALPPGTVRLETMVRGICDDGVTLSDGSAIPARAVVVATGPAAAVRLLPEITVPETRAVTTYYHVADRPPLAEPTLVVDGTTRILNTLTISSVVPHYAPPGSSLISTSVLEDGSDDVGDGGTRDPGRAERRVRERLGVLYSTDAGSWTLLARYHVPDALPAMAPPWPLNRPTRVRPGVYVCGDYRATGSVQGAMSSGTRAAREAIADLAGSGVL